MAKYDTSTPETTRSAAAAMMKAKGAPNTTENLNRASLAVAREQDTTDFDAKLEQMANPSTGPSRRRAPTAGREQQGPPRPESTAATGGNENRPPETARGGDADKPGAANSAAQTRAPGTRNFPSKDSSFAPGEATIAGLNLTGDDLPLPPAAPPEAPAMPGAVVPPGSAAAAEPPPVQAVQSGGPMPPIDPPQAEPQRRAGMPTGMEMVESPMGQAMSRALMGSARGVGAGVPRAAGAVAPPPAAVGLPPGAVQPPVPQAPGLPAPAPQLQFQGAGGGPGQMPSAPPPSVIPMQPGASQAAIRMPAPPAQAGPPIPPQLNPEIQRRVAQMLQTRAAGGGTPQTPRPSGLRR